MQHNKIEVVVESEIVGDGVLKVSSYPKQSHSRLQSRAVYEERRIAGITHYMSRVEFGSRRDNILT